VSARRLHACASCLARTWLLGRLAGHLDAVRGQILDALALSDGELIAAVAGKRHDRVSAEYHRLKARSLRERYTAGGLSLICRCDSLYPDQLGSVPAAPAVLHVAGDLQRFCELTASDPVAIVGSRRASTYGLEVARSLGRGLAATGIPVVSGMAFGIDSAAHAGALDAPGETIAVLPGGADRAYPPAKRALYGRVRESGALVSELPPSASVRRWMFLARNRVIAALSAMTVVVEAGERSGSLVTAHQAGELGRVVGAVPGRITSSQAVGPHRLLAGGAKLVGGAQDVLDALFGSGARSAPTRQRSRLDAQLERLLTAISSGHDTLAALTRAGFDAADCLAGVSALELAGYVRRESGGRYFVGP
jgi:DNA processing protein